MIANLEEFATDVLNDRSTAHVGEICELLYSAPFTDEDYQNFRHQQGLFVELKDFPTYLCNEILGNENISIELSSIGESSISKQVIEDYEVILIYVKVSTSN